MSTKLNEKGRFGPQSGQETVAVKDILDLFKSMHSGKNFLRNITIRNCHFDERVASQLLATDIGFIFRRCTFSRNLNLNYSKINHIKFVRCQFQDGISLRSLETRNSVIFRLCDVRGEVDVRQAKIDGHVDFRGSVFLPSGLMKKPLEKLTQEQLKSICNRKAILLDGSKIGSSIFLQSIKKSQVTRVYGQLSFLAGSIGHQFLARGAYFYNPRGKTISMQGVDIGNDVFLNSNPHNPSQPSFVSRGEIDLQGSYIGGQFSIKGAVLIGTESNQSEYDKNPNSRTRYRKYNFKELQTLMCAKKPRNFFRQLVWIVEICLAHTQNSFDRRPIYVDNRYLVDPPNIPPTYYRSALSLRFCEIQEDCILRQLKARPDGSVILSHAKLNQICDDETLFPIGMPHDLSRLAEESSLDRGYLYLDGLTYNAFSTRRAFSNILKTHSKTIPVNFDGHGPFIDLPPLEKTKHRYTAEYRRDWLLCQPREFITSNFLRQPWLQCATVLNMGAQSTQAKRLVVKMEETQTQGMSFVRTDPGWTRLRHWSRKLRRRWLRGFLMNYGYSPTKPIVILLAVWMASSSVYLFLHWLAPDILVPTDMKYVTSDKFKHYSEFTKSVITNYPTYNSFLYALDLLIPVIDFGQNENWGIRGRGRYKYLRAAIIGVEILLSFAGWALTTMFLLGLTQSTFKSLKPAY